MPFPFQGERDREDLTTLNAARVGKQRLGASWVEAFDRPFGDGRGMLQLTRGFHLLTDDLPQCRLEVRAAYIFS
jgi:hypothetical protein